MSKQVKTEKPKTNKTAVASCLAAIGAGVWALIKCMGGKNNKQ